MNERELVELTIDSRTVQVEKGLTLMEAVSAAGEDTPVICYHQGTTANGLCRLCVVEVEGWRTLAPACVTQAAEGMQVKTSSERVLRARKTILEMLNSATDLSEAPEIQAQMDTYQADRERFPQAQRREFPVMDDNPFYVRDYEKCVLCWRCVQACGDDLQFTYALSVGGRGYNTRIATFFEAPMPETTCVFCGNCVAVCPTDALIGKTEFLMEQGLDYDAIRLEKRKGRKKSKSEVQK